jgi:hypothetical protein
VAALTALSSHAFADLAVVQVGAGVSALNNSSTATFVKIFPDAGGSPTATIAMPTAAAGANQPLTLSGSSTSEGFLKRSADGAYLTLGGYAVAPGLTNVANATVAAAPRAVARISLDDNSIDTTTAFSGDNTYSQNNIRSVVSSNGSDLWLAGNGSSTSGGVRYATLGSSTSTIISNASPALVNARVVDVVDGQLYVSSGSAPTTPPGANYRGVLAVGSGLPTAEEQPLTLLPPPVEERSSYDFWFASSSTLYIADDASTANGGGIQKYVATSGVWSFAYHVTTAPVRGLTGTVVDGSTVLYATTTQTSQNQLISVTDLGAGSTPTILATADQFTVFRGVEFIGDSIDPPLGNADFDGDSDVDGADFLTWQRGLGPGGPTTGDVDGNGVVDAVDLAAWKGQYGAAVAAASTVPEPASLALLAVAAAGAWVGGRRWR